MESWKMEHLIFTHIVPTEPLTPIAFPLPIVISAYPFPRPHLPLPSLFLPFSYPSFPFPILPLPPNVSPHLDWGLIMQKTIYRKEKL